MRFKTNKVPLGLLCQIKFRKKKIYKYMSGFLTDMTPLTQEQLLSRDTTFKSITNYQNE